MEHLNATVTGRNIFYPNCLILTDKETVSPYDEEVMSLKKTDFYTKDEMDVFRRPEKTRTVEDPMFFFAYNFDNYYHFLYDTIPYLVHYFELKKQIPNLKLLCNWPNPTRTEFYRFNKETFDLFGLSESIHIVKPDEVYSRLFVAKSLTRGNKPPDPRIYSLYKNLAPKKIYISRRTHLHGDFTNIGTDYTQRRRMVNEDQLVDYLTSKGFTEVFCENMSMHEKIELFSQATHVVGCIGGGLANLLFSRPDTKVWCIVSPYFMDINNRFKYSMDHTDITYLYDTRLVHPEGVLPLFVRVKVPDGRVGEITQYEDGVYTVQMSNNDVSRDQLDPIDNGLNSPFELLKIDFLD